MRGWMGELMGEWTNDDDDGDENDDDHDDGIASCGARAPTSFRKKLSLL